MGGNTPKTTKDYKEILADPSIDAVLIATPEHLHHEMAIAALKAGKHIYIEKPLAHTIEEGEEIVKVANASGKVVQVGTQNRSNSLYHLAKEMIAQGMIGDIHYVRAFWYRNSPPNDPAWRYAIPADASPKNTDWDRFLGTAPQAGVRQAAGFYQWRLYWDYSGGISTDLLVHQTDITNFVCGKTVPLSCMASGGIYRWTDAEDDREVPDTLSAVYEYPDKFHINYSCYFGNDHYGYGEQFMGNEGTIEVLNRQYLNFYPRIVQRQGSGASRGSEAGGDVPARKRQSGRRGAYPQFRCRHPRRREGDCSGRGRAAGGHLRPHGDACRSETIRKFFGTTRPGSTASFRRGVSAPRRKSLHSAP